MFVILLGMIDRIVCVSLPARIIDKDKPSGESKVV